MNPDSLSLRETTSSSTEDSAALAVQLTGSQLTFCESKMASSSSTGTFCRMKRQSTSLRAKRQCLAPASQSMPSSEKEPKSDAQPRNGGHDHEQVTRESGSHHRWYHRHRVGYGKALCPRGCLCLHHGPSPEGTR